MVHLGTLWKSLRFLVTCTHNWNLKIVGNIFYFFRRNNESLDYFLVIRFEISITYSGKHC